MAGDLNVRKRGTTVADRGDVGRRASDLDDDAVIDAVERNAPATEAAGPEYSVRAGARRKPARSVAPPSPRMTITGALDARAGHTVADDLGSSQRDRQDRRVRARR